MTDYTTLTLGYLLSHANTTIRRAAGSILKTLQRSEARPHEHTTPTCFYCIGYSAGDDKYENT